MKNLLALLFLSLTTFGALAQSQLNEKSLAYDELRGKRIEVNMVNDFELKQSRALTRGKVTLRAGAEVRTGFTPLLSMCEIDIIANSASSSNKVRRGSKFRIKEITGNTEVVELFSDDCILSSGGACEGKLEIYVRCQKGAGQNDQLTVKEMLKHLGTAHINIRVD